MTTSSRFDETTHARLRKGIMKKGQAIATLLADVLAGKDGGSALKAIMTDAKPGERPEEKLRRYLDSIESRRRLLDDDDDAFGRCDVCGEDLGRMALLEMPWADRCPRHAHC